MVLLNVPSQKTCSADNHPIMGDYHSSPFIQNQHELADLTEVADGQKEFIDTDKSAQALNWTPSASLVTDLAVKRSVHFMHATCW